MLLNTTKAKVVTWTELSEHVRTSQGIITAGAIIVQLATNYLTPTDAASLMNNTSCGRGKDISLLEELIVSSRENIRGDYNSQLSIKNWDCGEPSSSRKKCDREKYPNDRDH